MQAVMVSRVLYLPQGCSQCLLSIHNKQPDYPGSWKHVARLSMQSDIVNLN